MEFLQNLILCLGRICISLVFLWAGSSKIVNWSGTVLYMKTKNMPLIPLLLSGAILMQIGGAFLLILGLYTRIGALILIAFIIPAATKMHDFWNIEDSDRVIEKTMFMKDIAIFGGLLFVLVFGPGAFSLDELF